MLPISKLTLRPQGPDGPELSIDEPGLTVFVGPNNAGKSLVLREIYEVVTSMRTADGCKILTGVQYRAPDGKRIDAVISRLLNEAGLSENIADDFSFQIRRGGAQYGLSKAYLKELANSNADLPAYYPRIFFEKQTLKLDGVNRLNLVGAQRVNSFKNAEGSFARLFVNDEVRSILRAKLFDAFGMNLILDVGTQPGNVSLRYLDGPAPTPALERGLCNDSLTMQENATPIDEYSDGVKAFTGIMVELYAGDPTVLVIDEPEAFLHPNLAFKLGIEFGRPSHGGLKKNVFVATHSSKLLMGCAQSGADVNIVRLTNTGQERTACLLSAEKLRSLFRNPMLRSIQAVEALFYDYAVVVEAASDRAFYDEINQRLLAANDSRGIPNCLFIQAHGKDTLGQIISPLRDIGIPTASIVDIDVYKMFGKNFSSILCAIGMPEGIRQPTSVQRTIVEKSFIASGTDPKTGGGVAVLKSTETQVARDLFGRLAEYGLFTVQDGELEFWLRSLPKRSGHGPKWLAETFELMHDDPEAADYVKPGQGDVWDFLGQIGSWLKNPLRKGLSVALPDDLAQIAPPLPSTTG